MGDVRAVSLYSLNGLRENRYEVIEIYLFVHKDLHDRDVNFDRDFATLFCIQEKF
jgi:hypothetical protein